LDSILVLAVVFAFAMRLPVMCTGPVPGSQFVLLLGAIVPGFEVSTSLLVVVWQVIIVTSQPKPHNTFFAVLAPLDNVLVFVSLWCTLGLVAFHLVLLVPTGSVYGFSCFIRH
jgi:hypothetical protein